MVKSNGALWQTDKYLHRHANTLHDLGALKSVQLSDVQLALVSIHKYLTSKSDLERRELDFLERLFISDPARYSAHQEEKKSREAYALGGLDLDAVVDLVPSSDEERRMIEKEFQQLHDRHSERLKESQSDNLESIDLSKVT